MNDSTTTAPEALFVQVDEGYTAREAVAEAKRCLHCKNPLCVKGCPIEHSIPDWIHELSKGNLGNAMEIINRKSNLPAVCGRVCPHENQCEGHCILNKKGNPIRVGKLERFIADFVGETDLLGEKLVPKTRGKICVIGSGPAGLSIAGDLARRGFNVTIFEMESELGGVLMFGIPEYRLPKAVVQREIRKIESLGVTYLTNVVVGRDVTIDQLFGLDFDAIFIGTGTVKPKGMSIPGHRLRGVVQSQHFLRQVSLMAQGSIGRREVPVKAGDRVVVIGGGNVAMDGARTAVRMGAASVVVMYRRTREEMPALRSEYEDAVREGVEFRWKTQVVSMHGAGGWLKNCTLRTPEGEEEYLADVVMMAIGSEPASRIVSTTKGIDVDDRGYIVTRERPYGMTTRKGVFAGGDVVNTPQTIVLAMRDAKKVAEGIEQYVDAMHLLADIEPQ